LHRLLQDQWQHTWELLKHGTISSAMVGRRDIRHGYGFEFDRWCESDGFLLDQIVGTWPMVRCRFPRVSFCLVDIGGFCSVSASFGRETVLSGGILTVNDEMAWFYELFMSFFYLRYPLRSQKSSIHALIRLSSCLCPYYSWLPQTTSSANRPVYRHSSQSFNDPLFCNAK
jgi:hypothetical protein